MIEMENAVARDAHWMALQPAFFPFERLPPVLKVVNAAAFDAGVSLCITEGVHKESAKVTQ